MFAISSKFGDLSNLVNITTTTTTTNPITSAAGSLAGRITGPRVTTPTPPPTPTTAAPAPPPLTITPPCTPVSPPPSQRPQDYGRLLSAYLLSRPSHQAEKDAGNVLLSKYWKGTKRAVYERKVHEMKVRWALELWGRVAVGGGMEWMTSGEYAAGEWVEERVRREVWGC